MKEYKAAVAALLGERTDTEVARLTMLSAAKVKALRTATGGDLLDVLVLVGAFASGTAPIRLGLIYEGRRNGYGSEDVREALGDDIRERRRRLDWTQTHVAAAVGCNTSWLCQIELGRTNPRLTTLVRIAAALDAELGLSY